MRKHLYNLGDRTDNAPYSIADWFARPSYHNWFNYPTIAYDSTFNLSSMSAIFFSDSSIL